MQPDSVHNTSVEQSKPTQKDTCASEDKIISRVSPQSQFSSKTRSENKLCMQCVELLLEETHTDVQKLQQEFREIGDLIAQISQLGDRK